MLSKLKTTLAGSYKGLTAFALAVIVLSGVAVNAAPVSQAAASPQIIDPVLDRVERNCVFRYTVDNSITKAVNLRTVTEITMDKNGAINVQTINGTRDINISVPARTDKVTFLQGVLYQWERCIATR